MFSKSTNWINQWQLCTMSGFEYKLGHKYGWLGFLLHRLFKGGIPFIYSSWIINVNVILNYSYWWPESSCPVSPSPCWNTWRRKTIIQSCKICPCTSWRWRWWCWPFWIWRRRGWWREEEDHRGEAESIQWKESQEAQSYRQDLCPLWCETLGWWDWHGSYEGKFLYSYSVLIMTIKTQIFTFYNKTYCWFNMLGWWIFISTFGLALQVFYLQEACKSIEMDGLVWGATKLVPVGYGINKLQIMCTVEDDKVSIEELSEKMTEFEDFVQSVDVAAMNKI